MIGFVFYATVSFVIVGYAKSQGVDVGTSLAIGFGLGALGFIADKFVDMHYKLKGK